MIDEKKGGNGIMGDGSYGVLFIFSFFFYGYKSRLSAHPPQILCP